MDVIQIDRRAREDAASIVKRLRDLADQLEKEDDCPTGFAVVVVFESGSYITGADGGPALKLIGALELVKHDLLCTQPAAEVVHEDDEEGA